MTAPIAINAIFQNIKGKKLRLADFAMHCADRIWIKILAINQIKRRIELLGKEGAAAAIISESGDSRKRVLFAKIGAKGSFHAPDCNERAGWNAITLFNCSKKSCILLFEIATTFNDRWCSTNPE